MATYKKSYIIKPTNKQFRWLKDRGYKWHRDTIPQTIETKTIKGTILKIGR